MRGIRRLALVVLGLSCHWAESLCPNSCSGHGTCGEDDVCHCYQHWGSADVGSGDCSQRFCPKELAYVGHPNKDGNFHYYLECGGKGICDRSTGECDCFEHFSGKGCARRTCPGAVEGQPGVFCNGHGSCEFLEELPYGDHTGLYYDGTVGYRGFPEESYLGGVKFPFQASLLWEHRKIMHCKCDATYSGADCSLRACPHGNDIIQHRIHPLDTLKYYKQNLTIYGAGPWGNGTGSLVSDFYHKTFALRYTNMLNESFLTQVIEVPSQQAQITIPTPAPGPAPPPLVPSMAPPLPSGNITSVNVTGAPGPPSVGPSTGGGNFVQNFTEVENKLQKSVLYSLLGLPNRALDKLGVEVQIGYDFSFGEPVAFMRFMFEFYGERSHGDQKLLSFVYRECIHCTPQLGQYGGQMPVLHNINTASGLASYAIHTQTADYNNYVCGRRGKCDYDTGICHCFEGFSGEACGIWDDLL